MTKKYRAAYMAAYEWMLDVQRRLMFTTISVEVETQYTPDIDEWSLTLWIHMKGRSPIRVDYYPWDRKGFNPQKKYIEGLLDRLEKKEE